MSSPLKALLVCLSIAMLAGCDELPSLKAKQNPPLTIAVVGPMSGPYTRFGGQMRAGVEQEMAHVNARGGVLDSVFKMRGVDDRCESTRAASVAKGIAAERPAFVVGHFCSEASIAAAPIYTDANLLMISPSSSDPALTERGAPNIFRTVPRQDMQGPVLAKYIADHFSGQPVAIISDGTPYALTITDSTRKALRSSGIHPVVDKTMAGPGVDFTDLVTRLKDNNVGVIVYGGNYKDAARLLVEARRQGSSAVVAGGDTLVAAEFWQLAGSAGEGSFMAFLPDPLDTPRGRTAAGGLGEYGVEASGYTLYAYAAVEVVVQAAERAKSMATADLIKEMHGGTFDTAVGMLTFDDKGDVTNPNLVIYVWRGGAAKRER
ncbi:MAG TPA: branched-chain amino acid ABC transporter substrate-binding protein [Alphaproteobacteria bacterium]|nr:branched-chain amino acid ABC transporter substrate-binding protein [Alphaproteobacteria bacterium]